MKALAKFVISRSDTATAKFAYAADCSKMTALLRRCIECMASFKNFNVVGKILYEVRNLSRNPVATARHHNLLLQ
jgi:hypothetical protein